MLRALAKREIKRIGRNDYQAVDVRVIAATNRDLIVEVDRKAFRSDLYYWLAVLEVRVPPLRERLDDLDVLVPALLQGIEGTTTVKEHLQDRESIRRLPATPGPATSESYATTSSAASSRVRW